MLAFTPSECTPFLVTHNRRYRKASSRHARLSLGAISNPNRPSTDDLRLHAGPTPGRPWWAHLVQFYPRGPSHQVLPGKVASTRLSLAALSCCGRATRYTSARLQSHLDGARHAVLQNALPDEEPWSACLTFGNGSGSSPSSPAAQAGL